MAFAPTPRALIRIALLILAVVVLCNFYNGLTRLTDSAPVRKLYTVVSGSGVYPTRGELEDLRMGDKQCRATFPGLMKEIDDAVARGPFELERQKDDYTGLVQARIENGKVNLDSCGAC